jgi:hypothetical protein
MNVKMKLIHRHRIGWSLLNRRNWSVFFAENLFLPKQWVFHVSYFTAICRWARHAPNFGTFFHVSTNSWLASNAMLTRCQPYGANATLRGAIDIVETAAPTLRWLTRINGCLSKINEQINFPLKHDMVCSLIFDKHQFIRVSQHTVGAVSTIYMAPLNVALAPCQHGVGSQSTVCWHMKKRSKIRRAASSSANSSIYYYKCGRRFALDGNSIC